MNKLIQAKELSLVCATRSTAKYITTSFSHGMTKARIDQEIPKMYERLLLTSQRMCAKYNRTYDSHEVVSIAYEYIVKIKSKIETTDQLKRWMTARICQEIAKSKSVTNQKISISSYEVIENIIREQEQEVDPYENEVKAVETYSQINDRVKRRVFEVYYNEGQNTCRKMASYFNISIVSAMNLIQEMKQDLIEIAQNETF
jgi:hypothetical protein